MMRKSTLRFVVGLSDRATRELRRQDGQALIEYALILGLIVVVAVGALQLLGPSVSSLLADVEAGFP